MKNRAMCPDDLLVLARRGELCRAELRQLQVYLQASPVSRVLHDLGHHYDTLATDRPNDDALIERVVSRASECRTSPSKQQGPRRPLQLAAVILLGLVSVGVAAATATHLVRRGTAASAADTQEVRRPAPPARAARSSGSSSRLPSAPADPVDTEAPVADETSRGRGPLSPQGASSRASARSSSAAPQAERVLDSAAGLFSQANKLRKARRLGDAERAYRQLQLTHGGSPEAAVSHVLLGRILLRQGKPGAACAEFERYLAGNPGGSLAEDALQGQAMGLRALGRHAEEKRVWETLLSRFPGSIYARVARERLEELGTPSASVAEPSPAAGPTLHEGQPDHD